MHTQLELSSSMEFSQLKQRRAAMNMNHETHTKFSSLQADVDTNENVVKRNVYTCDRKKISVGEVMNDQWIVLLLYGNLFGSLFGLFTVISAAVDFIKELCVKDNDMHIDAARAIIIRDKRHLARKIIRPPKLPVAIKLIE